MRQSERLRALIVPATRWWCAIVKLAHDDPQADVDQVKFLAMLRSLLLGGEQHLPVSRDWCLLLLSQQAEVQLAAPGAPAQPWPL